MNHRARLLDENDTRGHNYLDCAKCELGNAEREHVRCGYVPEDSRTGTAMVPPEYPEERPDICPGYLVQLPQVLEAARANSWRKQGALREFYGGGELTPLTKLGVDIIETGQRQCEGYNIRNPPKRRD